MKKDEKKPIKAIIELLSANELEQLEKQHRCKLQVTDVLLAVYAAETLPTRLDAIVDLRSRLIALTNPVANNLKTKLLSQENPVVKKLLSQCNAFIRLILNAKNDHEIEALLKHREKRLPFKPDFVRDAPKESPLRQLLDDLVAQKEETAPDIQRIIRKKITQTATDYFRQAGPPGHSPQDESIDEKKQENTAAKKIKPTMSKERKKFIALSIAHNLYHLYIKGSTRVIDKMDQINDLRYAVKEFKGKELEEKRAIPYAGRLYHLTLMGQGKDACFKVNYYSTKELIAHVKHKGEGIFVVTTSGDIFAGSTSNDNACNIYHSSFDRNPFFAGRICISAEGILEYYDTYTGHFKANATNLKNVTLYFRDIALLSDENPNVVAAITLQRGFVQDDDLPSYTRRFPEFPFWIFNHNLKLAKESSLKTTNAEELQALHDRAIQNSNDYINNALTTSGNHWIKEWADLLPDERYDFNRLGDHFRSDPLNLHRLLETNAEWNIPGDQILNNPAQDNRNAGIRNDFDSKKWHLSAEKAHLKLAVIREKVIEKTRIEAKNFNCRLRTAIPKIDSTVNGTIYFYPLDNENYCGCTIHLPSGLIHTANIELNGLRAITPQFRNKFSLALKNLRAKSRKFPNAVYEYDATGTFHQPNELEQLKRIAISLQTYEQILLIPTEKLINTPDSQINTKTMNPLGIIQDHLTIDGATAFADELVTQSYKPLFSDPRSQAEDFWEGVLYINRTNRNGQCNFFTPLRDGKSAYKVNTELPYFAQIEKSDSEDGADNTALSPRLTAGKDKEGFY